MSRLSRKLQVVRERWGFRSLVALLVSTVIGLALAGVAIRAWSLDWRLVEKILYYQTADLPVNMAVEDPHLLYRLRPDAEYGDGYVHINHLGFRGKEYEAKKPEGVFRVLCLGGSNVYGLGLAESETWPAQLEKMLNLRYEGRFEAWNCGMCAHAPSQTIAIAREAADRYEPDVILLALSNRGAPPFLMGAPIEPYFRAHPEFWDLTFHKNLIGRRQSELLRTSRDVRFLLAGIMGSKRLGWFDSPAHEENNIRAVREFLASMRKRSIRTAGFLYPGIPFENFRVFFDGLRVQVLALEDERLPKEYADIHPPPYVMTWYGEEIARWLAENGLLGTAAERPAKPEPPISSSDREGFGLDGEVRVEESAALLPGGRFMMGCSPGDGECYEDESPRHAVTLDPFLIDLTEITNARYRLCVEAKPCTAPAWPDWYREKPGDHPVVGVTHWQAEEYCRWRGGRLPSEAQWEFAARAGSPGRRYAPIEEIAWFAGNSERTTHPVGQKRPNAWGLYDMLGNAWEWVLDQFAPNYYSESPSQNPVNISGVPQYVLRGGGWFTHEFYVRASYRHSRFSETFSNNDLGFRCVTDASGARK